MLWPGATKKAWEGLPSGRPVTFRDDDSALLRARVPEIALVSSEYQRRRGLTVGTKTVNARICGVEPDFGEIRNQLPQPGGRFLNDRDLEEKRRVIFLGDELARTSSAPPRPVGKTLQIDQSTFTWSGSCSPRCRWACTAGPTRTRPACPSTTFKAMFTDAKPANLVYKPASPAVADQAKASVYRVLGRKYRFDPEDERAVGMWDTRENQRITDNISLGIQLFLGIIGALTLFVGGMGVANIMYAVVKERTREIGVKMALGAKVRQVMAPFVLEALLITVAGGIAGHPGGGGPHGRHRRPAPEGRSLRLHGPAHLLARSSPSPPPPSWAPSEPWPATFPGRRAAHVNPAESLRYE